MKKLLALLAVAGVMTACNNGNDEVNEDTTTVVAPVETMPMDTTMMMDTTLVDTTTVR